MLELVEKPLDWWFNKEIAWRLGLDEGRLWLLSLR